MHGLLLSSMEELKPAVPATRFLYMVYLCTTVIAGCGSGQQKCALDRDLGLRQLI